MIHVLDLNKTCSACPSQWEGKTEDGRDFYARYRWGILRVTLRSGAVSEETLNEETVYQQSFGGGLDGYMKTADLKQHLAEIFTFAAPRPFLVRKEEEKVKEKL